MSLIHDIAGCGVKRRTELWRSYKVKNHLLGAVVTMRLGVKKWIDTFSLLGGDYGPPIYLRDTL